MAPTIFIDGEAGTTGLQISERLSGRKDLTLLHLADTDRKDPDHRRAMLNQADLAVLCLPDAAAIEAVSLIENGDTKVIDASTAHRVDDGWIYGFPEYDKDQRSKIGAAKRVANPGCYAICSVAILHPLISSGLVPADWPVTINAVSGYSGGGKGMIAQFEDESNPDFTRAAYFTYGHTLSHKHVPEITRRSGLAHAPIFMPSVGRYPQGMIVQVPLALWSVPESPSAASLHEVYENHYGNEPYVEVMPFDAAERTQRLEPEDLNGTNKMRLFVFSNEKEGEAVVMAQVDNLGKGAAGQAVQNLNIMLGLEESAGL